MCSIVTGCQTCAFPIYRRCHAHARQRPRGLYRTCGTRNGAREIQRRPRTFCRPRCDGLPQLPAGSRPAVRRRDGQVLEYADLQAYPRTGRPGVNAARQRTRSEEHTSELQSLMRNSYAVFCLKKKKQNTTLTHTYIIIKKYKKTYK